MSRRMMMAYIMSHQSRLPAEFQEVEYIESSGTQYINGLLATNLYDKIVMKMSVSSWVEANNGYDIFVGARQSSLYNLLRRDGGNTTFSLVFGNTLSGSSISLDTIYDIVIEYGTDTQKMRVNETDYQKSGSRKEVTLDSYIFGANQNNAPYRLSAMKLYACKFYNGTTLLRDFIPCYRKADNVIGLYDLVNGVFYTNAGTGTFIVGGNV